VAAHLDSARIADELQLENWKRFGQFTVNDDQSRRCRGRNRHGDDSAASGQFALVYVAS
jgi:hypothetical protein